MKKVVSILSIIGLTASLGAYATVPTTAAPFQLTIPNLESGFELYVSGLYLQPASNNDLDYAKVSDLSANLAGPGTQLASSANVLNNNPSYGYGFEVGIGYTFANSGNDVQLSWASYNHATGTSVFTDPGQFLSSGSRFNEYNYQGVYNFGGNTFTVNEFLNAGSNVKDKFNVVDLDVGQYVDIGTRLRLRFFGGLRAAEVEENIENLYHDMTDVNITNAAGTSLAHFHYKDDLHETYDSRFQGLGPLVGVKTSYNVWKCFGVTGLIDTAMLVGKVDSSTSSWQRLNIIDNNTNASVFPEVFPTNIFEDTSDNVWRVVPVIDAKLGVNYSYIFGNKSTLTLAAGYQTSYYFDAIDKVDAFTNEKESSNVAHSGPYASINFAL